MSYHRPAFPHVPRAHVDPLTSIADVLAITELAITRPLCPETVVLFLDSERRGCGLSVVSGTASPDAVLDVAECLAGAAQDIDSVDGIVLVSVRPGDTLAPGDVERWHELRLVVADHGLELIDWIVLGRQGPELPRAVVDPADPWDP